MSRTMALLFEITVLIVLINSGNCQTDAPLQNISLNWFNFDFDDIKNSLFSGENFNFFAQNRYSTDDESSNPRYNDMECAMKMDELKESLQNYEHWALELVDAWGKIPSGILSGNTYEFGEFSQCLGLKRDKKPYDTQYCLGQFVFDLNGIVKPKTKSFQNDFNDEVLLQNWQTGNQLQPMPRIVLPKPKGGQAINFGICLPDVCSPFLVETILTEYVQTKLENVTIEIPVETCQFEEISTEIGVGAWITIVLLTIVLLVMVASTSYDLWCTFNNLEKYQPFLAFSVYSNGIKLFSCKQSKSGDMMHCLHGIRAISTQWVVLGHTFCMYLLLPIRNKISYLEFVAQYHNMIIMSGLISVDTFFVMSGLLVSVNMLKHLEKTRGRINIVVLYLHRYLRLTPLLGVAVLFSTTLLRFCGTGPLWPNLNQFFADQCERNWWSTLLYVQNYVNSDDICFGHSWYLSVDTQLFFISPFVMYLIYMFGFKAVCGLSLMVVGCVGCTLATYLKHNFGDIGLVSEKLTVTYYPTHLRFSPWLIGVFGGYLIHESRKRTFRIPKIINLLGWAISLALMATVVFANYPLLQPDRESSVLAHGFYDSLSRVAWAIALCYIIFACIHGYGGPVNWFLSYPAWQPISRLCYSIYLLHFPVILVFQATMKTTPYFSEVTAWHAFVANYTITIFVAIIGTLAFESPIVIIEKMIFGQQQTPPPNREDPNEKQNTATNDCNGSHIIENGKV